MISEKSITYITIKRLERVRRIIGTIQSDPEFLGLERQAAYRSPANN
jgi:hypothetical protein